MGKENIPVWGGIECTINRIDNKFYDQLQFGGYYKQPEQLKAVLGLGIKTIRFPLLWEKHQPLLNEDIDWSWAQEQLSILQANKIEPVIGLLHHGSGPAFTDLLQKDFPEQFASYAAAVAARFPWLTFYNPVNEPLTTARFSGLYGLWYPHKKNDVSFIRILLNELKAVNLAMKEIRKINPGAKLVQTEDLGKTYSTSLLSYQANFENHRRWLTYDILTGKFNQSHALWDYFMRLGIEKDSLQFFIDNPCTPDTIGVNHYVTSERYLDEAIQNYPLGSVGGNGIHQYADVEAVRVAIEEPHGLKVLLSEMWERYHLPIAITEVHLHCSREQQVRWLKEVYDIAVALKQNGINIYAVTAWALLGSFGWNKLLTNFPGEYETGAFDINAGMVRPTGLAKMISNLITQTNSLEHLTGIPGWWKSGNRFFLKTIAADQGQNNASMKPVIIIGKTGTLGQAFAKICGERNLHHFLIGREEADIENSDQLELMIAHYLPWAIINAAGFVDIDRAEEEKDLCYRQNNLGPQKLAIICERLNIKLLTFSSDQVFDGNSNEPYKETHVTNPVNIYGHSKQLAELFLHNVNPASLIIRTSAFFGPWDQHNFISKMIAQISSGEVFHADADITISPAYVPHLVHACLDLLIDDASGIWHLVNEGSITWYEWARKAAMEAGLNTALIIPEYNRIPVARRPRFSALASEKYLLMPSLQHALEQYLQATGRTKKITSFVKDTVHEKL